jgi:hypothetical protein
MPASLSLPPLRRLTVVSGANALQHPRYEPIATFSHEGVRLSQFRFGQYFGGRRLFRLPGIKKSEAECHSFWNESPDWLVFANGLAGVSILTPS